MPDTRRRSTRRRSAGAVDQQAVGEVPTTPEQQHIEDSGEGASSPETVSIMQQETLTENNEEEAKHDHGPSQQVQITMSQVYEEAEKAASKSNEKMMEMMSSMMSQYKRSMMEMANDFKQEVRSLRSEWMVYTAAQDEDDDQDEDEDLDDDEVEEQVEEATPTQPEQPTTKQDHNEVLKAESSQSKRLDSMIEKLTLTNFEQWEASMSMAAYVFKWQSKILEPPDLYVWCSSESETMMEEVNRRCAYNIIYQTTKDHFSHLLDRNIVKLGDATAAFKAIKSHFHRQTISAQIALTREFATMSMSSTNSNVLEFASQLRAKRKLLVAGGKTITEMEMITRFIDGLIQKFEPIKQTLLTNQVLNPNANENDFQRVVDQVYDYACRNNIANTRDSKQVAHTFFGQRQREECRNWKAGKCKFGSKCKYLHVGEPSRGTAVKRSQPMRNNSSQPQKKVRFKGKCNYCGIEGHKEADCWKKQRETKPASGSSLKKHHKTGTGSPGDHSTLSRGVAELNLVENVEQMDCDDNKYDNDAWVFMLDANANASANASASASASASANVSGGEQATPVSTNDENNSLYLLSTFIAFIIM